MTGIKQAAAIGCGVIGAGWVARLVENGIDVRVYDPASDLRRTLDGVLDNSRRAYSRITDAPRRREGRVEIVDSISRAVEGADLIIESVPERLAIKRSVYTEIEMHARNDALVTSSTSGLLPTELQAEMRLPERLLVAHPFNPVYLIPLVELVGGEKTDEGAIERASQFFDSMGMVPLRVRKEIEGFIADRLLEAVWREALWLVKDGIATTGEIDDAVRFGFGLRYAQMGIFDTYRMAGGSEGMRHFLAQFGPCLKWPWTKLMDVPEMDADLIERIASQSDDQSSHLSISEMERMRDENLIAIIQGLKGNRWGAGKTLAIHELRLRTEARVEGDPAPGGEDLGDIANRAGKRVSLDKKNDA